MIILVTGVAGFIGSNFIDYFLNKHKDHRIIGLDKLTYAGNINNLFRLEDESRKRFKFIKGDIINRDLLEKIFSKFEIDGVINFAAESHVDRSIIDSQEFLKTNIMGLHSLLDIAKKFWMSDRNIPKQNKFLQISTDEVYGSLGKSGYFTENTSLNPRSPYSASKAAADFITKAYYDTYSLPVNITRCSNNFGPFQFPEKLIPLIISNTLKCKPVPIYGDGKNIRDWLYVDDHCRAIDLIFENASAGEIYNIGGNNEFENLNIAKLIIQKLRDLTRNDSICDKLIKFVKDRPGHDRRYAIDSSKIQNEFGWEAEVTFDEGIQRTIEWYSNNQTWLEDIFSGEYIKYNEKYLEGKLNE